MIEALFSSQEPQIQIGDNNPLHNINQNNDTKSLDVPFTEVEIQHAINKLKSDHSRGPDETCFEMFTVVIDDVIQFLTLLLNDIYNQGMLPEDWCEIIITPVHKS